MADMVSNQIGKIQTNKKLIALYDKLNMAPLNGYAQIHAQGETVNGRKCYSLIGVEIQDYSAGTGNNNIKASFNLSPEFIQYLFNRVSLGYQDFDYSAEKIFGAPDRDGLSKATSLSISRHPYDKDGKVMNRPWFILIRNGRGKRVQNQAGGGYMQRGSFVLEKQAFINVSDDEIYGLLCRAVSFIKNWETVAAFQLIQQGKQMYAEQAAAYRKNSESDNYSQGTAGGYDQYAAGGYDGYGQTGGYDGYGQAGGYDGYGQAAAADGYGQAAYTPDYTQYSTQNAQYGGY